MRKTVSNLLFNTGIFIFILTIILTIGVISQMLEPNLVSESNSSNEIIIYDTAADWNTVKAKNPFELKTIDRKIEGHFIDSQTPWCFFSIAKSYNYNVDIDGFYEQLLGWYDNPEISYEGKLHPDWLYQYSLVYITANKYDFSVDDISDKGFNYLIDTSKNGYPIVVWIEGNDWIEATPYILYKVDSNYVYLISESSSLTLKQGMFKREWDRCGNWALVYGKYW